MEEHIYKGGECTLIVNAVMGIETFVLGIDESVTDILRYTVNGNGYSLNVCLDALEDDEFLLAFFVCFVAVEVGIAS